MVREKINKGKKNLTHGEKEKIIQKIPFYWIVVYVGFFKACGVPSKNIKYLTVSMSHRNYISYLNIVYTITIPTVF